MIDSLDEYCARRLLITWRKAKICVGLLAVGGYNAGERRDGMTILKTLVGDDVRSIDLSRSIAASNGEDFGLSSMGIATRLESAGCSRRFVRSKVWQNIEAVIGGEAFIEVGVECCGSVDGVLDMLSEMTADVEIHAYELW